MVSVARLLLAPLNPHSVRMASFEVAMVEAVTSRNDHTIGFLHCKTIALMPDTLTDPSNF